MWTMVFIIITNLSSEGSTAITNIPGFASKEACKSQASLMFTTLREEYPKSVRLNYHCVEVK